MGRAAPLISRTQLAILLRQVVEPVIQVGVFLLYRLNVLVLQPRLPRLALITI
jgi:hypothetical protein